MRTSESYGMMCGRRSGLAAQFLVLRRLRLCSRLVLRVIGSIQCRYLAHRTLSLASTTSPSWHIEQRIVTTAQWTAVTLWVAILASIGWKWIAPHSLLVDGTRYDLRDMTAEEQKTLDHPLRQALRNRELRDVRGLSSKGWMNPSIGTVLAGWVQLYHRRRRECGIPLFLVECSFVTVCSDTDASLRRMLTRDDV